MSGRSDALLAVIREAVDLERELDEAMGAQATAQREFVAANEALEATKRKSKEIGDRLLATRRAGDVLAERDSIGKGILSGLVDAERRRR